MRAGQGMPVRVRSRLDGAPQDAAPLDARATLTFRDGGLDVALAGRTLAVPYESLDGVMVEDGALVLFGTGGRALRLEDLPDLDAASALALDLGQQVPEVTRGLRGFASVSGAPGSDHDLFFGPLLAARRVAHAAAGPVGRRDAFDAAHLREGMRGAASDLARRRFPAAEDAGDRRALEAELDDLLVPAFRALDALEAAARTLASAPPQARLRGWRDWCAALSRVFEAVDDAWIAALPALADSRGAQGALWRRVLRRGPP